jgi:uncharacterized OsmC-like protein
MTVQTKLNGLDLEAINDIVSAWQADPEKRKTVWRSRIEWEGGFRNTARAREHAPIQVDEPAGLGGSDTAPNPAELLLGAVGTCLSIGYVLNAAARGIELQRVALDLEGDIDLSVFAGLAEEGTPGYSDIRVRAQIKSNAPADVIRALHDHVVRTSPICSTVARPVNITSEVVLSD